MDELLGPDGRPRPAAAELLRTLSSLESGALQERQRAAEAEILTMGITRYRDTSRWPGAVITPM